MTGGFERIRQNREPLASEVVRQLIDGVLANRIRAGERLPSERKLSEMLGVGRSVVREALKSLTVLGLVEVRQGDGTYLRGPETGFLAKAIEWGLLLGTHEAADLVEARCHLEEVLTSLAGERRSDADLEDLRRLMAEMEASTHDTERFVAADLAFHAKVAEASGNSTLQRVMLSIASLLGVWIGRVMQEETNITPACEEHRRVLVAIEAGDPVAARAAAAAHMQRARSRLERSLGDSLSPTLLRLSPRSSLPMSLGIREYLPDASRR